MFYCACSDNGVVSHAGLSQNIVAQDLFRDPEELKSVLMKNYGLKEELIDTIFNSKINLTNVNINSLYQCTQTNLTIRPACYLYQVSNGVLSCSAVRCANFSIYSASIVIFWCPYHQWSSIINQSSLISWCRVLSCCWISMLICVTAVQNRVHSLAIWCYLPPPQTQVWTRSTMRFVVSTLSRSQLY